MQPRPTFRLKLAILRNRNFLAYWTSGNLSFVGDMFGMFAMQMLVMHLTGGDAAAMGTVMAISGIPRFVFVLFGGVLMDRFSPIRVVILVRYSMAVTQAVLAILLFTAVIQIWMLYVFAVITGAIGSFLMPAQMTIVPSILEPRDLPAGNALNNSAQQVIQSMAPAIVGFCLALLSGYDIFARDNLVQDAAREVLAYGYAFFINAGCFVLSAVMLIWVHPVRQSVASQAESLVRNIWTAFERMWADHPLRAFVLYIACSQLFTMGAQAVGQPIMALERFQNLNIMPAALALGMFGTSSGIGAVLGSLIGGFIVSPTERWFGLIMMSTALLRGLVMIGLCFVHGLFGTMVLFVCFGTTVGYTSVLFMTWMQTRIEISMLGRMMGIMLFSMMGLMPISMAISGWGIDVFGLDMLFLVAGSGLVLVALIGSCSRSIRLLGYPPERAAELLDQRTNKNTVVHRK